MKSLFNLQARRDEAVTIGEILDYCESARKTVEKMKNDAFAKIGHGMDEGGLLSFLAYAQKQEELLGYCLPSILDSVLAKRDEAIQPTANVKKVRLPTRVEWDRLANIVDKRNDIMHWQGMMSWCQDKHQSYPSARTKCGGYSAHYWDRLDEPDRCVYVGFRPAFDVPPTETLGPNGTIVAAGTLYMDDLPVKVPVNPTKDGDIPDYIPGAKLEFREAIDDAAYQVQAIKVGDVLIADRVLLKNISWDDLHKQGIC